MGEGGRSAEAARLVRNASSAYVVRGLLALSALLVTPYLFRRLGPAGFGTWSVMFTLTTVFSLAEVGFAAGLVRFVAAASAAGDRARLRRLVGTGVTLMTAVGVLACAVAVASAFLLLPLAASEERGAFRDGMLVLGAAMLVRLPTIAYAATLNGFQRYDLTNASLGVTTLVSTVGYVVAVEAGTGVRGLAVATAVGLVVGGVMYAVALRGVDSTLPLRPVADTEVARDLARFSSLTLLADAMIFVGQRMDVVLIAAIRNAATAAPFAAALKLQSALQSLTLPLMDLLMPMASELAARGRRDEVARRLAIATRGTLQITLPLAVALALFADDIVDIWLGGGDAAATAATIIALLAAVQTITLTSFPAEKVLIGIGRARMVAALATAEGLSNLALSAILVWRFGAVGAAIGTLCTNGVLSPLRLPLVARALGVGLGAFLRRSVVPALVASAPACAAMTVVWSVFDAGTLRLVLGVAMGTGLAAVVAASQIGVRSLRSLRGVLPARGSAGLRVESDA